MPSRKLDRDARINSSSSPPIRGFLSAPSKAERTKGWRLIQLSDIRDELQVLLPPRPAAIYANLLKVEAYTISRNDVEHLEKVRYLKEVMIRKCEKLAEERIESSQIGTIPPGGLLFEAPLDFRVRRLEQWWEHWEKNGKSRTRSTMTTRGRTHTARPLKEQASNRTVIGTASGIATHTSQGKPIAPNYKYTTSMRNGERLRNEGQTYNAADEYVMVSHTTASLSTDTPLDKRKTLAPIAVASSSHIKSPQHSPLSNTPQTGVPPPNYQNVPIRSQLLSSPSHQSTPHISSQPLAAVAIHGSQAGSSNLVPTNGSTRQAPFGSMTPIYTPNKLRDPRLVNGVGAAPAEGSISPTKTSGDPSYLKNQFHATYAATPSDLSSSPSAVSPLPRANAHGKAHTTQAGLQPAKIMNRKAHTVSYSANAVSIPISEREHRRRATVDCEDTERSVPRPKGYMYASATAQLGTRQQEAQMQYGNAGHSPSMIHRMARALRHGVQVMGSSSSASSSPRDYGRNPALAGRSPSGSPQSQCSHTDNLQNGSYSQKFAKGSPNLLAPIPTSQTLSSPGSNTSSADASQSTAQHLTRGRNKIVKRPSNQQMRPKTPDHEMQQATRNGLLHSNGQLNDRASYAPRKTPGTPYHTDRVMPDAAEYDAPTRRDSRYTSGGSSVSEPVIPDLSLIREVELNKNKADRIRRRRVPYRSSSEESMGRNGYVETDFSDFAEVESDDDDNTGFYKRPNRSLDGYESGYFSEVDGLRARSLSRPPSRPPSRGILKRSSSACSQRSNKSVRLEIPKDRRALEEVRDAEEKVDHAEKQLRELLRHPDKRTNTADADVLNATAELNEAKRQLEEKEEAYDAILDKNRHKKVEMHELTAEPRYV